MKILEGDCVAVMAEMDEASVDAIVTDPPAGISFMGKEWDSNRGSRNAWIAWLTEVMGEALRVLKPGAHGLVWALPRTSHWTAMALEDAGFEVRDRVTHHFGSGFPKSANVSKHIDKMAGAEREKLAENTNQRADPFGDNFRDDGWQPPGEIYHTAPATDEAKQWDGWGSALKPATEDWWLIRKPLAESSIARQVLSTGTGVINVDASRIHATDKAKFPAGIVSDTEAVYGNGKGRYENKPRPEDGTPSGRFPANLIFSHHLDCRLESGSQPGTMELCRDDDINSFANTAGRSESPNKIQSNGSAITSVEGSQDVDESTTHSDSSTRKDMSGSGIGATKPESTFTSLSTGESGEKPGAECQTDTCCTTSTKTRQTTDSKTSCSCGERPISATISESQTSTPRAETPLSTTSGGGKTTPSTKPSTPLENGSGASASNSPWCHPACPVGILDRQSGPAGAHPGAYRNEWWSGKRVPRTDYNDKGGASRFFKTFDAEPGFAYIPKSSRRERNAGLGSTLTVKYNSPSLKKGGLCGEMVALLRRVTSDTETVKWVIGESGASIMGLCPPDSLSIISTAIRRTMTSLISPLSMLSPTSEYTPGASCEMVSGGSHAAPAVNSSRFQPVTTSAKTEYPLSVRLALYVALHAISDAESWTPLTNFHATVKPIALMRYLCRLITPPGGTVLDPFAGSGSTGCAAVLEGFDFIGIERESEYAEIARRRIAHWSLPEDERPNGKPGKARNTYGFKSTDVLRRCPEHGESIPSGSTLYKCGCQKVWHKVSDVPGTGKEDELTLPLEA